MADNPEATRLDQHQQQLERLTQLAERQAETNRRLETASLENQQTSRRLTDGLAKTDEILLTFGQVQSRMLDELEKLRAEQVRANRRQDEFARRQDEFIQRQDDFTQRQDEFNVHFLEEIRHIKQDSRGAKDETKTTVEQHEERRRRREDFMNGLQNAA